MCATGTCDRDHATSPFGIRFHVENKISLEQASLLVSGLVPQPPRCQECKRQLCDDCFHLETWDRVPPEPQILSLKVDGPRAFTLRAVIVIFVDSERNGIGFPGASGGDGRGRLGAW